MFDSALLYRGGDTIKSISFNGLGFHAYSPMPTQFLSGSWNAVQQRVVAMTATPWCHGLLNLTVSFQQTAFNSVNTSMCLQSLGSLVISCNAAASCQTLYCIYRRDLVKCSHLLLHRVNVMRVFVQHLPVQFASVVVPSVNRRTSQLHIMLILRALLLVQLIYAEPDFLAKWHPGIIHLPYCWVATYMHTSENARIVLVGLGSSCSCCSSSPLHG